MGIYIHGMEMPKDGWITLRIYPSGDVGIIVGGDCKYHDVAIPVLPHGDLIDRKQLIKSDHQHYEYLSDEFYITVRDIEAAPTIIPAEEGE